MSMWFNLSPKYSVLFLSNDISVDALEPFKINKEKGKDAFFPLQVRHLF